MYKMIVSDFYDALIDREEAIPLSTMIEIDKIRQKGILFCISTSKSARFVIDYNKDFPFIDYVIAFNGAYVYDLVRDKVLYNKNLGVLIIKKLYKMFSDKNMCFYTLDHCNYIGDYKDKDYSRKIDDFPSFVEEYKKEIYSMKVCFTTKDEATKVKSEIDDLCLNVKTYIKAYDNMFFVEIYSNINNRLFGLNKICNKTNIDLNEVVGIGVSNDSYELIKNVGCSYCLSNACGELKTISTNIGFNNNQKGVEQVIKNIYKSV